MNYLLYMPIMAQIVTVTVVFSVLSVLGLYLVRVLVPLETLKKNHEVAGFTFGVLGAFYGLLLAFVIVAAWERFDRANENVEEEGVALISLYRLSKGFAAPAAGDMQQAIRAYTHRLIDVEWPAMADSKFASIDDSVGTLPLWQIVATYKPENSRQTLLVDKSFDQLSKLTEETSLRYLYSEENLPSVVWLVIYAGLLITIGFSYFFGLETFWSQALMCATFSTLLGLTILAILELAHPYQGTVIVSAQPFRYALSRMDDMDKVAFGGLHRDWRDAEMSRLFPNVARSVSVRMPAGAGDGKY
ncbi:MAG TPA: DUF4239 domain-containing protein [Candidatus Binataceae bacterium]|nr:DUF4239 domain-containing protein [Candidatus Binataceae bacterium]